MQHTSDIIIIGAGIMGLFTAKLLAENNLTVTLIEKTQVAKEASWAGGGIISPLYPWRYDLPISTLAENSTNFYQALHTLLINKTQVNIEWQQSGLLMLDCKDTIPALNWAKKQNQQMSLCHTEKLYPHQIKTCQQALWMPNVGQVRTPRVGQALKTLLLQHPNITIFENNKINQFKYDGNKIIAAMSGKHSFHAEKFIITAGCWSQKLLSLFKLNIQIFPVRGQMLLVALNKPLNLPIILHRNHYIIPRKDSYLLIGSTLEHSEFDKSTTLDARNILWHAGCEILPEIKSMPIIKQWAGLRPGSMQYPFIGNIAHFDNLYVNAGHFRNGLVTAPKSCELLKNIILNEPPIIDPKPYEPKYDFITTTKSSKETVEIG